MGEEVTALRLAKVVILQTAYPQVFDHLKSNGLLLKQLELLSRETEAIENVDPILSDAVKQTSLKKLFRLLPDDASANFADLELDQLTPFFSLARRAPVLSHHVANEEGTTPLPTHPTATPDYQLMPAIERPFQLRSPVRDFVGRKEQLAQMTAALRKDASVGVVTGMAGTGKTEFALLVAESLRQDYADGQLFVDMQGTSDSLRDPAEALSTCIRAFVRRESDLPSDIEELGNIYRSKLHGKRVLILLDNAASAAQVTPLIPPKRSVLLITSRNSLVLPGMVNVSLDQLRPKEALALFRSIYLGVSPELASKIAALCGYLPPAVRAAASTLAATPDLNPYEYAKQLEDEHKRIELLGAEGPNVSLDASFSLSYSRLSPQTASVFRRLSVFPDTFDAPAEEVICGDDAHLHLSELVKLSLVSYSSEEGRYRVHSLMRLFAQRHLTPEEGESVARDHAAYYLDFVKETGELYRQAGDSSIKALSLFDRERENINAGFKWSARSLAKPLGASFCSDYVKYAAEMLELRLSPRARVEWFTQALEAARQKGDVSAELVHLIGLAGAYRKLDSVDHAIAIYKEAMKLAEQAELRELKAELLSSLGLLHRDDGEIQLAMSCFEEQLAITNTLAYPRGVSIALINLANVYLATGEIKRAIEYFEQAWDISQRIVDVQTEGLVLANLGRAYNQLGETERALDLYRRQLEISQRLGDRLGEAAAHFNIGVALEHKEKLEDLEEAFKHAQIALRIYEDLESPNAKKVREWVAQFDYTPELAYPEDDSDRD